ncbi:hypothetical protein JTE90_021180 [Oedothorax gibbosus]|uniref:Uncharacterized protein n=1 Tax=Oedothorax gibbosus TaxID=931172 RepID=A0AAV6V6T9_9ARAC|nr:hypothetical protein JTE90_021180 [Oedothorax gibbosus]
MIWKGKFINRYVSLDRMHPADLPESPVISDFSEADLLISPTPQAASLWQKGPLLEYRVFTMERRLAPIRLLR